VFTFVVGGLILGLFVIYAIFGGDDDKKSDELLLQKAPPAQVKNIAPPADLPDEAPPPPPLPFETTTAPPPPEIEFEVEKNVDEKTQTSLAERLKSPIMVLGGSSSKAAPTGQGDEDQGVFNGDDSNMAFAKKSMQKSVAPTVISRKIRNMRSTIAQGRIINAVLETAINTQLPGPIRAIVSRDTYAEHGRAILIPKGSRLIGVYNTNIFNGQQRVFIVWNRVIRPDGVDVMINSIGVDDLGRAGVNGFIDTRFGEMLSAVTLTSLLGVGMAYGVEQLGDGEPVQQTQGLGNQGNVFTTTNAQSSQQAAIQGAARIGQVGTNAAQRLMDMRPRITIDQGTTVNVFVQNDLVFPDNIAGSQIIP
jgi:type IV secretion system protein VirB10